jgi:hypothetical protein
VSKWALDDVIDAGLDIIDANVTQEFVCSGQPADFAGVAAVLLATSALAAGDITLGDGATGRMLTIAAKNAVTVDATGTATHVALCSAGTLYFVTTCTSTSLTATNQVNLGQWTITCSDPT